MTIEIIKGNLLDAFDRGEVNVIGHCCNMQNTFGSGIAKSIKDRYPVAYEADTQWYNRKNESRSEFYSIAFLSNYSHIFNLYGQEFYGTNKRQLNYGRFSQCLNRMSQQTCKQGVEVIGFPYKMGCDRAGGDWEIVLEMIEYYFRDHKVKIYQLES